MCHVYTFTCREKNVNTSMASKGKAYQAQLM